eukprot:1360173-Amorphochlora_amoeboformis.AAC.1
MFHYTFVLATGYLQTTPQPISHADRSSNLNVNIALILRYAAVTRMDDSCDMFLHGGGGLDV